MTSRKELDNCASLMLTPRLLLRGEPSILPTRHLSCGELSTRLYRLTERIGWRHAKRLLWLWGVPGRLHLHLLLLLHRVERVPSRIRGKLLEALHLPREGPGKHTTTWLLELLGLEALGSLGEERLIVECRSGELLLKAVHTVQPHIKRCASIELLRLGGE